MWMWLIRWGETDAYRMVQALPAGSYIFSPSLLREALEQQE